MEIIFLWIELIGTFVFAITGAMIAIKADYDFFGMLFLAFLTAVGGGTVRDIILDIPVFWTQTAQTILIILIATITCLFFKNHFIKYSKIIFFFDTLGLGLFSITGTQKALLINTNISTALIMGLITGVLGGVMRSAFSREEPIIFKKEIYASTAFLTSLLYLILNYFKIDNFLSILICLSFCLLIRIWSIKYKIHLPKAR